MMNKIDASKLICKILQTEINNVVDEELIKSIKDPNYVPDLIPMNFSSDEEKEQYKKMVEQNLKG